MKRIFVNVPNARHVAVIDNNKGQVVATWKTDLTANCAVHCCPRLVADSGIVAVLLEKNFAAAQMTRTNGENPDS